jgi:hypothetical protein
VLFDYLLYPPMLGAAGLVIAFVIYHILIRHNHGDGEVKHIGDQIHLGAMVFMQREYKMLAMFAAVLLIGIFRITPGHEHGDRILGDCRLPRHVRRHQGQRAHGRGRAHHGQAEALSVAFYGGSIMGLCVASLGLLGLGTSTTTSAATRKRRTRSTASAWAPPRWRCSPASAAASSPRAPTSARTWWARSRPASPKTTRATRASSPTTWATTWATSPAWARTSSSPTAAP